MGGKPFQSKGCATCRKRKIKCDEQKPYCQKCIKHGSSCPGYEEQRIICYHHKSRHVVSTSSRSKQLGSVLHRCVILDPCQDIRSGPSYRDQVTSSFINIHFPAGVKQGSSVDVFQFLFTGITALPRKTWMLEQAISAISCVFIGKLEGDARMLRQGVQLYNSCIRQMCQTLERKTYSDELLYASVIFQELEAIYCPDGLTAYVTHVTGLNSLINQYLSLVLESPLTATIYHQHQKFKVLLVSYMEMSDEDYRYLSQSTENEPFLELIHILADLALLCQKSSKIRKPEHGACHDLLSACLGQKSKQEAWYARWKEEIGGDPSLFDEDFLAWPTYELFGPAYQFPSLDNAKLHILLWNASTILYSLIHLARTLISSHLTVNPSRSSDPSQDEDYLLSIAYADRISRSLPYFTQPGINARGTYSLISAVRQLAKTYSDTRNFQKFQWVLNFLGFLSKFYDVAGHAREIVSAWWPGEQSGNRLEESSTEKTDLDLHWSWKCRLQGMEGSSM